MDDTLTLPVADDFHLHLRSGAMLRAVLPFTAQHFHRALIMPNRPWIGDADALLAYRDEILWAAKAAGYPAFEPLMTIALEDSTTPKMIEAAKLAGAVAAKLYPLGATTGPESGGARGVAEPLVFRINEVYRAMADLGMVLCVHAECPPPYPRLDREHAYLSVLDGIIAAHPSLKISVEHVSDGYTARWLHSQGPNLFGTITCHHLLETIDDALETPHSLCNPVPKFDMDREILWAAVTESSGRFGFGSDSAPHPVSSKHCARPACGCFSAPGLLPRLATMFEARGLLDRLGPFVGHHGADFYGLARNEGTVTLVKRTFKVPERIWFQEKVRDVMEYGARIQNYNVDEVIVWRGGETLPWSVEEAPQ